MGDTEATDTDFHTVWSSTQTARTPTASQFPALPRLPLRRPRRRGLLTPSTAMAYTALALSLMPDSDTAPDITLPTLGPLPPSLPQLRPKPRRPPQRRRRRGPLMPTTATEPDTDLVTDTVVTPDTVASTAMVTTPMAAFMADMDSQSLLPLLPRKRRLRRRRRGLLMPTMATEPDTDLATDTEVTPDTVASTAMVATTMVAFMADMDSQSLPLPLPRKRRLRRRRRGPLMPTTATEPDTALVESDLTTLPQSSPPPRRRRLPPRSKQTAIKSNESRWTAQQKYAYNQNPSSFSLALWSNL